MPSSRTTVSAGKPTPAPRKRTTATKPRTRRRKPTHGEISERAYFIYLSEAGSDDFENWLRAERELLAA